MDNRFELLNIVNKFLKDIDKTRWGSRWNLDHIFVAKLKEHGKESVIDCFRVIQLCEFSKVLRKNQLCPPFILRLSHTVNVLDILNELVTVLGLYLSQEYMQVSQSSDLNIINIIFQESFHDWNQISFGDFRS